MGKPPPPSMDGARGAQGIPRPGADAARGALEARVRHVALSLGAGAALDGAAGAVALAALVDWLALLEAWNARIDLTAARSRDELVDLMVADAAFLCTRLPAGARVVDVGTGAGAPGLGLALFRPDLRMTLVEPLKKRVAFLRTVLGTTGRTDVTVVDGRVEAHEGAYDVALSRATLAPAAWLEAGRKLAPDVAVLLAREEPPEGAPDEDETYAWPHTGQTRRVVRYRRA